MADSNSLAAGSCSEEEELEVGGSWRILLTWSLLVSTVPETERKESCKEY